MADQMSLLHHPIDTPEALDTWLATLAENLDLTDTAARFRMRQNLGRVLRSMSNDRVQTMLKAAGLSNGSDPAAALVRWYAQHHVTVPSPQSSRVDAIEGVVIPAAPTDTQQAAARAASKTARPRRVQVLLAIAAAGSNGLTDDELVTHLRIGPNTVRPRRGELVEAGLVIDSGVRRASQSGNPATVWILTADGIAAAQAHNTEAAA